MRVLLAVACLATTWTASALAFTPSAESEKLSETLYLIRMHHREGGQVNTLLSVGPDGLLLVDYAGDWKTMECPPEAAEAFDAVIQDVGGETPLRYLVNTHWHGDHVGGNERYGDEAVIIAHTNTRKRLMATQTPWWWPDGLRALEPRGWPDVTFDNSMSIHVNGEDVQFMYFGPAHTDGDIVVYFPASHVAHVGDLFHGFDHVANGEDFQGLVLTYAAILGRLPRETRLVTGHGDVVGMGELQRFQGMVAAVMAHVRAQVNDGKTLEQVKASGLPKPWDEQWTGDPETVPGWLENMYRTMTEGNSAKR